MCCGVTSGLALEKFSGSFSMLGKKERVKSRAAISRVISIRSL